MMECYVRRSLRHMGCHREGMVNDFERCPSQPMGARTYGSHHPDNCCRPFTKQGVQVLHCVCPSLLVTIKAKLIKRLNGTPMVKKMDNKFAPTCRVVYANLI
jgi:hypothetical protein